MRLIITMSLLFSFSIFAQEKAEDVCLKYKNQRKCESSEAVSNKCKWLKAKEICKNEDVLKSESEENEKGFNATENEDSEEYSRSSKKDKKKKKK